jgi:hypothetical protein
MMPRSTYLIHECVINKSNGLGGVEILSELSVIFAYFWAQIIHLELLDASPLFKYLFVFEGLNLKSAVSLYSLITAVYSKSALYATDFGYF